MSKSFYLLAIVIISLSIFTQLLFNIILPSGLLEDSILGDFLFSVFYTANYFIIPLAILVKLKYLSHFKYRTVAFLFVLLFILFVVNYFITYQLTLDQYFNKQLQNLIYYSSQLIFIGIGFGLIFSKTNEKIYLLVLGYFITITGILSTIFMRNDEIQMFIYLNYSTPVIGILWLLQFNADFKLTQLERIDDTEF